MNFDVADGAILVARIVYVVETRSARTDSRAISQNAGRIRMAFQAEEPHDVPSQ